MYYPMSLAFSRLSTDTDRADASPRAHASRDRVLVPLSRSAVHRHLRRAGGAASRRQRRRHGACTPSIPTASNSSETPDDYLLFLGRFTEGKGVLQAIDVAAESGMKLLLVAAENDYYRSHVAPLVDGTQIVYFGEADHATKVRLYGGARALLYPVQAREPFGLVLAESMACGTPVAALDRGAVREIVDEGVTGCVFESLDAMVAGLPRVLALDRQTVRERAVSKFRCRPHGRRIRRRLPTDSRRPRCFPRPMTTPVLRRPNRARHLRASRRRVAGVRRHARAARRRGRRVVLFCATRGERGGADRTGARRCAGDCVRVQELRCAAAALGIADVILMDHPDGELRWARVPEFQARNCRGRPPLLAGVVITFGADGLYWHKDHIGVYERTITALALARRGGPAALPRHDAARYHTADRRSGAVREDGCRRRRDSGASCRTRSGCTLTPPTIVVDVQPWVARKVAAIRCHRTQMGAGHPFDELEPAEAERWLGVEHFHRVRRLPAGVLERSVLTHGLTNRPMRIDTLDILRCPFCGGRLELVDVDVPPPDRR